MTQPTLPGLEASERKSPGDLCVRLMRADPDVTTRELRAACGMEDVGLAEFHRRVARPAKEIVVRGGER